MRAVDDILRRAKRLTRNELLRLMKQLDEQLSSKTNGSRLTQKQQPARTPLRSKTTRSKGKKKRRVISYARTLALAGTAHSNWTDVSSHKGKHLAEVYATRHGE